MAKGECKALSLIFRIAALGLSVGAAVVMATASQQLVVAGGSPASSSSYYYSSVSYTQYNALRFFVAAGAIAAVCSAAALYLFAIGSLRLVPFLDAAAQGLLFSAAGAALTARDVLGSTSTGGKAAPWGGSSVGGAGSVCDVAGTFCGRVTIAAAVCAFAAVSTAVAALARGDGGNGSKEGRGCDW